MLPQTPPFGGRGPGSPTGPTKRSLEPTLRQPACLLPSQSARGGRLQHLNGPDLQTNSPNRSAIEIWVKEAGAQGAAVPIVLR
eukprot:6006789-Alexandrium_andersonii.AAC.1